MKVVAEKSNNQNKNKAIANNISQQKSKEQGALEFKDNREEVASRRKSIGMIDNNLRTVAQRKMLQVVSRNATHKREDKSNIHDDMKVGAQQQMIQRRLNRKLRNPKNLEYYFGTEEVSSWFFKSLNDPEKVYLHLKKYLEAMSRGSGTKENVIELSNIFGVEASKPEEPVPLQTPGSSWVFIHINTYGKITVSENGYPGAVTLFQSALERGVISAYGRGQSGVKPKSSGWEIKVRRTVLESHELPTDLRLAHSKGPTIDSGKKYYEFDTWVQVH